MITAISYHSNCERGSTLETYEGIVI